MKTPGGILFAVLSFLIVSGCSQDERPTTDQVEPLLRTYLIAEKRKSCGGSITVDRVTITRIGDFESKLDGWPVYATFGVTCAEGDNTSVWQNEDTSATAFASVVRKKQSGEYECFMPAQFQQSQNAMQKQMDVLPQDLTTPQQPKVPAVGR
jgi:hypothetical protein